MTFGPMAIFSIPWVLPVAPIPLEDNAYCPIAIISPLLFAAFSKALSPIAIFWAPFDVLFASVPKEILSFFGLISPAHLLFTLNLSALLSWVPKKCFVSSVPLLPMILQLHSVSVLFKKFVAIVVAAMICPSEFTVTTGIESMAPYFLAVTPVGFKSTDPFP